MLIVLAFRHADQAVVASWKAGLGLVPTTPNWLEIPVIGVNNPMVRGMIRSGMRGTYHELVERAHVAPAFGDTATLAKGFGVTADQVAVIVVDHDGEVIAEAKGTYDARRQGHCWRHGMAAPEASAGHRRARQSWRWSAAISSRRAAR